MKTLLVIALTAVVGYTSGTNNNAVPPGDKLDCVANLPEDTCTLPPLAFISKVTVNGSNCDRTFPAGKLVIEVPQVKWRDADPDATYTFLLIGNGPKLYFGVSNINGSALTGDGNIKDYTQIAWHVPVNGTTLGKRSTFFKAVIYLQTHRVPANAVAKRDPFDAWEFAIKHDLCGPKAGVQAWTSPV